MLASTSTTTTTPAAAPDGPPPPVPHSTTTTTTTTTTKTSKADEEEAGDRTAAPVTAPGPSAAQPDTPLPGDRDEGPINVMADLTRFAKLSAPNTLVMLQMYLQWSATLSVAAQHLGPAEMSGVSLASLTQNLSGLTIVYGLLSAVDTLAPQSFAAGNLAEVGILVQRGIVTVFATFIVTAILWFNAEDILLAVGQPPAESKLAAVFLRYNLLGVPALALWESSRRFMWSQEVTQWPFVLVAFASLIVHLLGLHFFIAAFGFVGTPIAHVVTNWSMVAFFGLWVEFKAPHDPRTWVVSRERVMDPAAMRQFLRLAVPGILTMSEWVFFEFFIFLSGTLGETALAASSAAYTLIPMAYTIPSGLSIATTARVGALLAQGRVKAAKQLTRAVALVTVALGTISAVLIFALREPILSAFLTEPEAKDLARSIWFYLSVFILLDATFGVQCGLLRALGLQVLYAAIVFVCLFLIGLPVISALAFPWGAGQGLVGMYRGLPLAYVLLNACLFLAHSLRNWRKVSDDIIERERLARIAMEAVAGGPGGMEFVNDVSFGNGGAASATAAATTTTKTSARGGAVVPEQAKLLGGVDSKSTATSARVAPEEP